MVLQFSDLKVKILALSVEETSVVQKGQLSQRKGNR